MQACNNYTVVPTIYLQTLAGDDYSIITESPLILNSERPSANITINITDDDVLECKESIVLELSFPRDPPPAGVVLNPSTVEFTIMDNDLSMKFHDCTCMINHASFIAGEIGFHNQSIKITEYAGSSVNITFGLLSGFICDRVTVTFAAIDVDATASE